jgi:hypothetical protein
MANSLRELEANYNAASQLLEIVRDTPECSERTIRLAEENEKKHWDRLAEVLDGTVTRYE